jgi:hypothetical protein
MRRKAGEPPPPPPGPSFQLKTDTYDVARSLAPGWDVHAIEADWRDWISKKSITPWHAERHFLAFCKCRGKYPGFK